MVIASDRDQDEGLLKLLPLQESDPLDNEDPRSAPSEGRVSEEAITTEIGVWPLTCLLLGHVSCTFNCAAFSFALSLFLIEVFGETLVPVSLVGLSKTVAGMLLSGWVGGLVDTVPRLRFMQSVIGAEKVLHGINYLLFAVFFDRLSKIGQLAFQGTAPLSTIIISWTIVLFTMLFGSILSLVMTGMTVGIQRDWVTVIAAGDAALLTRLNTYLRRIDLLGGIAAPLIVSSLTTTIGYRMTFLIFSAFAIVCFILEFRWIHTVYVSFPALSTQEHTSGVQEAVLGRMSGWEDGREEGVLNLEIPKTPYRNGSFMLEKDTWMIFLHHPIFASSLAVAVSQLTTLQVADSYITYVKTIRLWSDTVIATLKAICEVGGIIGTLVMPILEKMLGLERAGAWSIWSQVGCLAPVVFSLFFGTGINSEGLATWNSSLLFAGTALSRIGVWSFDLCQLKLLQTSLERHPQRNRIAALQLSLQNSFNLLKFTLTMLASSPRNFKWTGLVSWLAVMVGAGCYMTYLHRVNR